MVQIFRALANEERLEILRLLKATKELKAQDVQKHFFLEQSTTSHHLNMLVKAGITATRKSGRNVYHRLNRENLAVFLKIFEVEMLAQKSQA